jgi:hypothetical protein
MTVDTVGFPPEDIQFLESQKWQVSEVARWLRIAPHKIGDLERATFSNIEEQNIDHVTSTLRAWFVRWEQQLDKDVVQSPDLFCEHNLDAALRGKTLERAQANVLKIGVGAMTPNEWRAQDNQNPLDWGDERVSTPNNTAPMPAKTMAESVVELKALLPDPEPQVIHLHQAPTTVEGSTINVAASEFTVDMPVPVVNVEAPTVNVEAPTINVEAPTVNVEAPSVKIDVPVSPTPIVNVTTPAVQDIRVIAAPPVSARVMRDDRGRISEIVE